MNAFILRTVALLLLVVVPFAGSGGGGNSQTGVQDGQAFCWGQSGMARVSVSADGTRVTITDRTGSVTVPSAPCTSGGAYNSEPGFTRNSRGQLGKGYKLRRGKLLRKGKGPGWREASTVYDPLTAEELAAVSSVGPLLEYVLPHVPTRAAAVGGSPEDLKLAPSADTQGAPWAFVLLEDLGQFSFADPGGDVGTLPLSFVGWDEEDMRFENFDPVP